MSTSVVLTKHVYCDLCKLWNKKPKVIAYYDARTKLGPWGNLCENHFQSETYRKLGVGYGQKIEYKVEETQ